MQDISRLAVQLSSSPEDAATAPSPSDWMFLQPAILDQMHDAIIATDPQGIVTGCNRAAAQLYGYTPEELRGKSLSILYPVEDRHRFHEEVIPTILKQGECRGEFRNRTRAGDSIWVHASFSLLRNAEGEPEGIVEFSINVTAQKLGDLAVKRSDEMNRLLEEARGSSAMTRMLVSAVEKAQDVILITEAEPVDLPGPRILYVNPAFERMTGYTAEEVVGQSPRILQGPHTDRAALERIRKALKRWKPVREEVTNYRKDGTEFTVELSIVPIADEKGWYTHWMAIQRDITEQNLLRKRLADGEARLHFLTEAMPQLLWTATPDGTCNFVSQSCADYLGSPASVVYGPGWLEFVHPEDVPRSAVAWSKAVQGKQTFTTEYRLRRNDGQYLWYLHRAVPRLDEHGDVLEWVGSSTDIEQQKRSEEAIRQTEKLAAVGRLASSIAHEINNPVSSVTNLLYLLGDQPSLSRTAREYVKTAQEEIARVGEITMQTLRFHQQSVAPAPTRIAEILDSVLAFHKPRMAACGVQLRREYESTERLRCLAGDIRQAMSNLVGNAVDALKAGGRLRVRLRPSVSWKHRLRPGVRISIADTGHGIEKERMRRIFEPFYTTKGITGTGLGLWITKDLVAQHEGEIGVRSSTRDGHSGTVISVFLPYDARIEVRKSTEAR